MVFYRPWNLGDIDRVSPAFLSFIVKATNAAKHNKNETVTWQFKEQKLHQLFYIQVYYQKV